MSLILDVVWGHKWFHSLFYLFFELIWPIPVPKVPSSVQFSRSVVSDSLQPHEPQHARPPCPSPTPRVYPNPCPSSRWCHHPFILSGVISPLISNSILGTYWCWEFIFQCPIFCFFLLFMGFSRQEYWNGLPFPSPVDHILSDLSTMTCPSWVALYGMAHSFIS